MPARADDIQHERPAVELAVDRAFLADRGDEIIDHVLRDVVVPWLDHIGLDQGRHLYEGSLADIDIPGAFLVFRLGDEAFDAESLDRRDLVVDARKPGVHVRDRGVEILDPLVDRGCQRAVRRIGCADAHLRDGSDAGQAQSRRHTSRNEVAPAHIT
ncbi:MAG: hypothetical protein JF625_23375 [Inquilinus limosus]|uniref:Uncharacterized protein n=1 Tax=Inquilinus limosus TaxID=171674 RepID=A0A952FTP3_9PROT|nr:hypothetical protein [Inquilinus limosus]